MAALQTADYIYLIASAVIVIMGLFRGLSGIFAFVNAVVAAGVLSVFFWGRICDSFPSLWMRALVVIVLSVVTFSVVRCVVKFVMRKMLSQPSDSIIGIFVSLALCVVALCSASTLPVVREYSSLAVYIFPYVGASTYVW